MLQCATLSILQAPWQRPPWMLLSSNAWEAALCYGSPQPVLTFKLSIVPCLYLHDLPFDSLQTAMLEVGQD